MQGYAKQYPSMLCTTHAGPLVLVDGQLNEEDRLLAAQIVARYTQGREADLVNIQMKDPQGASYLLPVKPMKAEDMPKAWYV